MKNKLILALFTFLGFAAANSQAGTLIANSSGYLASGCSWNFVYSGNPAGTADVYITVYALACSGTTISNRVSQTSGGYTSCNVSTPTTGYTLTGGACSNYSISTTDPVVTCPHSKEIYQNNVPYGSMSSVMASANTYCKGTTNSNSCGAAATPYNYTGGGTPSYYTVYCL